MSYYIDRYAMPIIAGAASGSVVTYMCMDAAHQKRLAVLKQSIHAVKTIYRND